MLIELRVHGVSGTSPEAMLGLPRDRIVLVSGDSAAGFYRATDPAAGRRPEAFAWGGLTSGPASRALWLLFVPFVLVNLAHWMLPARPGRALAARLGGEVSVRALRLLGLSLTLTLLCALVFAVLDVSVWQAGPPRGTHLAAGAVPVALAIVGILLIGRANPAVPQGSPPDPTVMRGELPLADPAFWVADESVSRLRSAHVIAWSAVLAMLTLWPVLGRAADPATTALGWVNASLLGLAAAATASNRVTGRGGRGADGLTAPLQALQWLSLAVLAGSLVRVARAPGADASVPASLPGLRGAVYVLLGVQIGLLAVLFAGVAAARPGRGAEGFGAVVAGFAAPVTATIALLVGGAFSVGIGFLAAFAHGTPVSGTSTAAVARPVLVPAPFFWAAILFLAVAVGLAVVGLLEWARVRRRARATTGAVLAEYTSDPTAAERVRAGSVASARAWAQSTEVLFRVAGVGAMAALVAVAVILLSAAVEGVDSLPPAIAAPARAAVVVIAVSAGVLIALTMWALRDRGTRRTVGVLWDIVTFWPRANHPLTPPCYAERAVPQLAQRVSELTRDGGAVVVAAHSQGSVIAGAAVLQGGPGSPKAALLTLGSPLRRLYARVFPAYFGPPAIGRLHAWRPRRWINLWAWSDPIGSWVLDREARTPGPPAVESVDDRLPDVTGLAPDSAGRYPPICGHSGYWSRREYASALEALTGPP